MLVCLAALGLLTGAAPASAATVTTTADGGPGSLRQLIAEAPPGELIVLPAGTYTLGSTLTITKSVAISGHAAGDTTIRAGGNFGVIEDTAGGTELSLEDLTIRDGHLLGSGSGAGISSIGAHIRLLGVDVTHNTIDAGGGPGAPGGAASGAGLSIVTGSIEMIDSSVTDNHAIVAGGAGKHGGAASGAGIFAVGTERIVNSTVADNIADARGGQGPANTEQSGGAVSGAGLFSVNTSSTPSRISGTTVSGNIIDVSGGPGGSAGAASGGGIFEVVEKAPTTYAESTIADNVVKANAAGGAVSGAGIFSVVSGTGSVNFRDATIASNGVESTSAALSGGDLFAAGAVSFRNTIIANGSGPGTSPNCFLSGAPVSLGFNLDSTNQCGFGAGPGDQVGKDPLLGPLQSNGGPTQTMAPQPGSPTIDQGSGGLADQRGVARPFDFPSIANPAAPGADGSDIGAVELQPSNAIALGKLVRNKKTGTATLAVAIPGPSLGTLTLSGKGLKTQTLAINGQTSAVLKVAPDKKSAKTLRRKGKLDVGIEVTYAPVATAPVTLSKSATLVRKHRRRHHKKHHGGKH